SQFSILSNQRGQQPRIVDSHCRLFGKHSQCPRVLFVKSGRSLTRGEQHSHASAQIVLERSRHGANAQAKGVVPLSSEIAFRKVVDTRNASSSKHRTQKPLFFIRSD